VSRKEADFACVAGISAALFALAFVIAPKSCDGGLEIYFWSGVAAVFVMLALPFAVRTGGSLLACFGWGLGFAFVGAAVWLAGLFAANFRILCRLF